jgi:hypothetical protein
MLVLLEGEARASKGEEMWCRGLLIFVGVLLVAGPPEAQNLPDKCEAGKLKATGQYGHCRLRAELRALKRGVSADYSMCALKFSEKWQSVESRWGGSCPTYGDEAGINTEVTDHCDRMAALLHDPHYSPPGCGNGVVEGDEQCDGSDLGEADCTSLGYTRGGTLSCAMGCAYDTSLCQCHEFPATGQTTAYTADKNDGIPGPVAVPDNGTVRAGSPLAYVDSGDGTITDLNTGLMWEKKSDDGGLHDQDNLYRWSGNGDQETIWDWLDDVNAEGGTGFAGYSDWRIPNVKELHSITNFEGYQMSVDPIFDTGCASGCTVITCSCTRSDRYWSATTVVDPPFYAWFVTFYDGNVSSGHKNGDDHVRAVRGGL